MWGVSQSRSRPRPRHMGGDLASEHPCLSEAKIRALLAHFQHFRIHVWLYLHIDFGVHVRSRFRHSGAALPPPSFGRCCFFPSPPVWCSPSFPSFGWSCFPPFLLFGWCCVASFAWVVLFFSLSFCFVSPFFGCAVTFRHLPLRGAAFVPFLEVELASSSLLLGGAAGFPPPLGGVAFLLSFCAGDAFLGVGLRSSSLLLSDLGGVVRSLAALRSLSCMAIYFWPARILLLRSTDSSLAAFACSSSAWSDLVCWVVVREQSCSLQQSTRSNRQFVCRI